MHNNDTLDDVALGDRSFLMGWRCSKIATYLCSALLLIPGVATFISNFSRIGELATLFNLDNNYQPFHSFKKEEATKRFVDPDMFLFKGISTYGN